MKIDEKRLENYNRRLSAWVGRQGLFFQLRYGFVGVGGRAVYHFSLVHLLLRFVFIGILIALLGFGGWWFWSYLRSSEKIIEEGVKGYFGVEQVAVNGVFWERGEYVIGSLKMEGNEGSFFDKVEVHNLRVSARQKGWGKKKIEINGCSAQDLYLKVKTGGATAESAQNIYKNIHKFPNREGVHFFSCPNTTIEWGSYTRRNRGRIEKSELFVNSNNSEWQMELSGGRISQNWLRDKDLDIIQLVFKPSGVLIEQLACKDDGGLMKLEGSFWGEGANPHCELEGEIQNWPLKNIIKSKEVLNMVNGSFSGQMKVNGSLNTSEGLDFAFDVKLQGSDEVSLYNKVPLVKTMSVLDRKRIYRKISFVRGSWQALVTRGGVEIKNIYLKAPLGIRMEGDLFVRDLKEKEMNIELENLTEDRELPDNSLKLDFEALKKDKSIPLLEELKEKKQNNLEYAETIEELLQGYVEYSLQEISEELKEAFYLKGEIRLGMLKTVFASYSQLQEKYPLDEHTGLRWITVPIDETARSLTESFNEEIIKLSEKE